MIHILNKFARNLTIVLHLAVLFTASPAAALNKDQILNYPYYDNAPEATVCATNLAGNDNAEKVWFFLLSKGLTPIQAAGAMGNLQHEGGFNPKRVEGGHMEGQTWVNQTPLQFPAEMDTVPPYDLAPIASGKYAGQPGYGIIQWTSPGRKQGLIDFAASKTLPVYDLSVQLEYMWSELSGPYKNAALDPLLAATDLAEAVRIWQDHYEVGSGFDPRMTAAQDWLAKLGSSTSPSSGGGCGLAANGCPTSPIDISATVVVSNIRVHPCISAEVERIITLANQQGLDMTGGGYRDENGQIEARRSNCGTTDYDIYDKPAGDCVPPTAPPGSSRHETGTAVDFICDGDIILNRSHPCYTFLDNNTSLINLPTEPWHWSVDGH